MVIILLSNSHWLIHAREKSHVFGDNVTKQLSLTDSCLGETSCFYNIMYGDKVVKQLLLTDSGLGENLMFLQDYVWWQCY